MAQVHGQDVGAEPYYSRIGLSAGFTPDPQVYELVAGGSGDASVITNSQGDCRGYINFSNPDYLLDYDPGTYQLGIYVEAEVDTTLVINDPAGNWYCNDDFSSVSSRNPGIVFPLPSGGAYKIWVGAYMETDNGAAAQLHISEMFRWQDDSGAANVSSAIDFGDDAGSYPNDGECDDPRFTGNGMASSTLDANRFHDATDCRYFYDLGDIVLIADSGDIPSSQPPAAATGTTIVSSGTGFFVSSMGHVVTNNHVIDGCVRNTIQIKGDVPQEAVVLARNETVDLALLKTARTPMTYASFRRGRPVRQGEEIVVYGFPLSFELSSQGNITNGLVAALSGIGDTLDRLQISAPVQGGNSGGPVMDRSGNVVAVIVSGLSSQYFIQEGRDIPQNVNFAIPGPLTTAFLDTNNVDYVLAESDANLSIADIGEMAQDFTGYILCYQ